MPRVRFVAIIASLLAFVITVSAVADPTINSYPVTPADTDPGSIVSGPDGDLWFTERRVDALGYITPGGAIGQRTGLSSPGYDLAVGPSGDLWITEPGAGAIARLAPTGVVTNFSVEAAGAASAVPIQIAAGPDGNMWFTADGSSKPAIGKITPAGVVTLYTHGLNPNGYPWAIAAGADGNLWFTELDKNIIGKITPAGTITEYALPAGATQPDAITAGPDGNLWFTAFGGGGAIGRITPSGTITLFTAGLPAHSQPTGIATGPDKNLWFTEAGGSIARITPAGVITQYTSGIPADSFPSDIVTGPDGNLWFTEAGDPGSIGRILLAGTPTVSAPTPTVPAAPAPPSSLQPHVSLPAIGRTAAATVVSGRVEVAAASGQFQPLSGRADIRIGDVIDTQAGVVKITTRLRAARHHSLYQTAKVWGGVFRLEQSRRRSLTTFRLVGAPTCGSSQTSHRLGHRIANSKKTSRKPILWARDHGGQYTTRGQNSVATVRGTEWATIESCAGTTTYVKRGLVAVKNLRTGQTVLVHAGQRYLARP